MCGIVGLFLKDRSLEPRLGALLTDMLVTMTDRGPDSAGIAIYGGEAAGSAKLTVQSDDPQADFATLAEELGSVIDAAVSGAVKDSHIVLTLPADKVAAARQALPELRQGVRVMSTGAAMEIYKEVGLPRDVAARLSNHNALRRKLRHEGIHIETENDTEVGAAYLTWKMQTGSSLGEALKSSLEDLDGFFTFVVGTKDRFGVVRDPIACKPAVMAETDQYVAFGSEYRALVNLPGIETARVWEPEPATVYFWNH